MEIGITCSGTAKANHHGINKLPRPGGEESPRQAGRVETFLQNHRAELARQCSLRNRDRAFKSRSVRATLEEGTRRRSLGQAASRDCGRPYAARSRAGNAVFPKAFG